VIWLVVRRYRVLMAITLAALVGLAVWMILLGHASDATESGFACAHGTFACSTRRGVFSLSDQTTAINFLLLLVPCLLGVVFGAPLVAGELEHSTNRLAWTQGVSRTKWLTVKWLAVGVFLVVLLAGLTLVSQWWTGQARDFQNLNLWLAGFGSGRLQPLYFPITGLALSAYTLFAFALSAALGAVIRKTSWAVFGTVVLYTALSLSAVFVIRPSLAPQVFEPFATTSSGYVQTSSGSINDDAWDLGFGFRYLPGTPSAETGSSADAVGQLCEDRPSSTACLAKHHLQMGTFYQPADHYWELQWRESLLLVIATGALFGAAIWSVRRWRA
jgi:ABC-type transport system involved in multi-copper enzyme maturation permease subunit